MNQTYLSNDNLNINPLIELERIDGNFIEAMCSYIRYIVSEYPSPYTLFVSGGVDSQVMLYLWFKSGAPFQAINISYNGFNTHDYMEMAEFAAQFNIPIEQRPFDILNFLENHLDDYAFKYKCSSPQLCTHMAFSEMVDRGTRIFSGNVPIPNHPSMNNTIFGLQRYAVMNGIDMIPFFLMSDHLSASIAATRASMIVNPPKDLYDFKCELYRVLGIPVIAQERKLTGFERLKVHYDQFPERVTPEMKIRHSGLAWNQVFDHLFRNKYMILLNNNYKAKFVVKK